MQDTVLLRSPYLGEQEAHHIERFLETRLAFSNNTGHEIYHFQRGSLPGSWSSSVAVNLCRQEWIGTRDHRHSGRGKAPEQVRCLPYVTVEGSVHKAIMGHNVYGGPLDPVAGSLWFLDDISKRLDLPLPPGRLWRYERVDWAEVYDAGSFEACEEYVRALSLAEYSRRKGLRYQRETVMFGGDTTAFKVYHKGPEFAKHDRRRVAAVLGSDRAEEVLVKAGRYLRVEVSVKARKLAVDFEEKCGRLLPTIYDVTRDYLEDIFDVELSRVLREVGTDMETVRKTMDVQQRLHEVYERRLANVLFGTWLSLAAQGEEVVKERLSKPTFYRHRTQLAEAGVSWLGSDVHIVESAIPQGFSLRRASPFRLRDEAFEVVQALSQFRQAA